MAQMASKPSHQCLQPVLGLPLLDLASCTGEKKISVLLSFASCFKNTLQMAAFNQIKG